MTYALLVKKLNNTKNKYLTSDEIKEYCKIISMKYDDAINYLTKNRYLFRIFRGIFYKPTIEERKLGKISINHLDALVEALKIKGIKNWYLGLDSALKLDNATHEFYAIDTIISDKIFRKKPLSLFKNKVKFIKIRTELTLFGIKKIKGLKYSNIEKTLLDIIYLSKYNGLNDEEIKNKIIALIPKCSKKKLLTYSKYCNSTTKKFVEAL